MTLTGACRRRQSRRSRGEEVARQAHLVEHGIKRNALGAAVAVEVAELGHMLAAQNEGFKGALDPAVFPEVEAAMGVDLQSYL